MEFSPQPGTPADTPATTIPNTPDFRGSQIDDKEIPEKSLTALQDPESASDAPSEKSTSDQRQIHGLRWLLVCLSLYVSAFLYGLDTTIAADVQGSVIEAFGHVEQLAWVGVGFPLGSVVLILLNGTLFTSFNMKWVYVAAVVLFEIGSVLCGAAPSMSVLIVGRVIAGAGGAGMYMGCLNYFAALTSREERGTYITIIGCFWGAGAVLGPVIGGSFAVSAATWRWAFYINLVVGAATAPIYLFFLPPYHPVKDKSIWSRVAKIDFLGLILGTAAWVMFTVAFTMGGGQWSWKDGRAIASIVVFGVVLILYPAQQYFAILTSTENRAFPGFLLKSRTQVLLLIGTAANISSIFVVLYFIPVYFQFVHGDSALMAAVRLLPFVVFSVTVNLLAGHYLPKIQVYMAIYVVSGVLIIIGGATLMAYIEPDTSKSVIYGLTVLIAIGAGLTVQIGYAVATLKVPPEQAGHAITAQNIFQLGGTVIALVIAGQVFQSAAVANLRAVLAGQGFSEQDIRSAVTGARSAIFERLTGDLRLAAIGAITDAIQTAFILVITSGAVVLIAGAFMKRERLFGKALVAA